MVPVQTSRVSRECAVRYLAWLASPILSPPDLLGLHSLVVIDSKSARLLLLSFFPYVQGCTLIGLLRSREAQVFHAYAAGSLYPVGSSIMALRSSSASSSRISICSLPDFPLLPAQRSVLSISWGINFPYQIHSTSHEMILHTWTIL